MQEIIKISEQDGRRVVNARELHKFLGSRQEFANWIKGRIEKYGFAENEDYTSFDKNIKRETGSSVRKEYAISLDMAKELSMVENNEKGREARKYFIACEKKLREIAQPKLPTTYLEALRELLAKTEELEQSRLQLEIARPKTEYFDNVLESETRITTTQIATEFGTSAVKLNRFLNEKEIIKRVNGVWIPRFKYSDKGYLDSRTILDDSGDSRMHYYWTEKGRNFIHELVNKFKPDWNAKKKS